MVTGEPRIGGHAQGEMALMWLASRGFRSSSPWQGTDCDLTKGENNLTFSL